MTRETLERIQAGIRERGTDYLRELATHEPIVFLDLIAYAAGPEGDSIEAEQAKPPIGPVRFVFTQQPDSDNRT